MLHGGTAKLKNQSPLSRSGLPKTAKFGTITNDHLEIFHEGFGKDSRGHLLNSNPLRNRRSDAYETVCKHFIFWEDLGREMVGNDLGKVLIFRFISFRFVSQTLQYILQILIFSVFPRFRKNPPITIFSSSYEKYFKKITHPPYQ
jgi:hypothetical protein